MKIEYTRSNDGLSIQLRVVGSRENESRVTIRLDAEGRIVGLEIVEAEKRLAGSEGLGNGFVVRFLTWLFGKMKCVSLLELVRCGFKKWQSDRAVEVYVLMWLGVELVLLVAFWISPVLANCPVFFVIAMPLLVVRLLDLLQVSFNVLLFDQIRAIRAGRDPRISSATRLLVLNLINYIELAVIFGVTDFLLRNNFYPRLESVWDSFYYSVSVVTTLGSSVEPATLLSSLAFLSELALGLVFIVLIIGRAISLLPPRGTISP